MASLGTQTRKFLVAGAFVAVFAAPALALSTASDTTVQAGPACLAWFGNKDDGNCLSYSSGNGIGVGTPGVGIGNGGLYTSPILPGTSWNTSIPIG